MAKLTKFQTISFIIIVFIMIYSAKVQTEQIDCNNVQCPPITNTECPTDSFLNIIPQPFNYKNRITNSHNEDETNENESTANELNRPEYLNNLEKNEHILNKRSLQYKRRQPIKSILPENYISYDSEKISYNHKKIKHYLQKRNTKSNIEKCCPKSLCICKNKCELSACNDQNYVQIKIRDALNTPGDCCPQYECIKEPNCIGQINNRTKWKINDCQTCQCLAGEKICHSSCGDIQQSLNENRKCFSGSHQRLFANNESWIEDACTICECHNGEMRCTTSLCKSLECKEKINKPGECCPICASENTTTSILDKDINEYDKKIENIDLLCNNKTSIQTKNINLVNINKQNFILYIIIVILFITCLIFLSLFCYEKTKKRSYRSVPSFDSNLNKLPLPITATETEKV